MITNSDLDLISRDPADVLTRPEPVTRRASSTADDRTAESDSGS